MSIVRKLNTDKDYIEIRDIRYDIDDMYFSAHEIGKCDNRIIINHKHYTCIVYIIGNVYEYSQEVGKL